MKIKDISAREILDSRGNPTIEVEMILDNDIKAVASIPSGASTGSREALELRDKDLTRYNGKGVLKAVANVNEIIRPAIIGMEIDQKKIDQKMLELDGTENKEKLGANAILGVSLATLKCLAKLNNKELFSYVADNNKYSMPIPMINIINGGRHAVNSLAIQEFMIMPIQEDINERIRCGAEVFHKLKDVLVRNGYNVGVGDEGGFAPNLKTTSEAIDNIVLAIQEAGYIPGENVFVALDCAASEFYDKENKIYTIDDQKLTTTELINYYLELIKKYPILSFEDPFFEDDFDALAKFTSLVGDKIMVVGDDYFVTNIKYLAKGINQKAGNSILIKANQVGTISEMLETINLAKQNNFKIVISHRSGETLDTFIADLAVGLCIPYIKTGSMSRGERICKYNRLMKINDLLKKEK